MSQCGDPASGLNYVEIHGDLPRLSSGDEAGEDAAACGSSGLEDSSGGEEWNEPLSAGEYHWSFDPDWAPRVHRFHKKLAADAVHVSNPTPLEVFELFFTPYLVGHVVLETNRHYNYLIATNHASIKQYGDFPGVSTEEMMCFFGLTLLMSRTAKERVDDYWSEDPLLETPMFRTIMKLERYNFISTVLHFSNNSEQTVDKLYKIKTVADSLKSAFSLNFHPGEVIAIKESDTLYKGLVDIKMYTISDCRKGYTLNFLIKSGKSHPRTPIVLNLVQGYKYRGHKLYFDRKFCKPDLLLYLYNLKISACGVVSKDQKNMPRMPEKLADGEMTFLSSGPLLAVKWCEQQELYILTTIHPVGMVQTGKIYKQSKRRVLKPIALFEYTKNMFTVKSKEILSSAKNTRKNLKWYKKVFFHLLDLSVANAHILYNKNVHDSVSLADYHVQLISEIFKKCNHETERSSKLPLRLTGRHFISRNVYPKRSDDPRHSEREAHVCVVCDKEHRTLMFTYFCAECAAPLCATPCFEIFHTKEHFRTVDVKIKTESSD